MASAFFRKFNSNGNSTGSTVLLSVDLTQAEVVQLGLEGDNQPIGVSMKYFDEKYECFSDWTQTELKAFSSFLRKLQQQSWNDVYRSGRKRKKTGLGYTVHTNADVLPSSPVRDQLSLDLKFCELRVNQRVRVHGFRVKSNFCLIWLDRQHRIYPQ